MGPSIGRRAKAIRPARSERRPITRWAAIFGLPTMSLKYVIEMSPERVRLRGATHLDAPDARLVQRIVLKTNCP